MTRPEHNLADPAPYKPEQLHAPLTPAVRAQVVQWMQSVKPMLAGSGPTSVLPQQVDKASTLNDTALIGLYKLVWIATQGGTKKDPGTTLPGNPFKGFNDIVSALSTVWGAVSSKQFWIRAAEFSIGGVLVIVGVRAAVQSELHPSSKKPLTAGTYSAAKKVAKVVK
jgi:hypothetical protein